jgi:hypothetical protein
MYPLICQVKPISQDGGQKGERETAMRLNLKRETIILSSVE